MNILLDVYLDRNLGDDLMIRQTAEKLKQHKLFVRADDFSKLLAFRELKNISVYSGEEVQAIVTVGGSMFELGSTGMIINRLKTTVKELKGYRRNGKKLATIGCNLGYVNRRLAEFAVREQLKQSQLVTLRDTKSAEKLKKIGVEAKCFPDMLFCCEMPQAAEKSGLLISAYRSVSRPENNFECFKKYAETADKYIERTGGKVTLAAFDCESENDISAAYTIKLLMKYPENAEIIAYAGNCEPILKAVSSASCVLGTRFHSIVLALVAGVPVLPVSYSDKTAGMLEDLGYDGFSLEHSKLGNADAGEIAERLLNHEELLRLTPQKLDEIRSKAKCHLESLIKFLEE